MHQDVCTLHAAAHDVDQPIFIEVVHHQTTTDARFAISQMWHKINGSICTALEFKPVNDSACIPHGALSMMRPIRLSGHKIQQTVTIHIRQLNCMEFSKEQTIGALFFRLAHQQMLFECGVTVSVDARVFVPRQSEVMSTQSSNDVVIFVSINVIRKHIRAGSRERILVKLPNPFDCTFRRLFHPAIGRNHVHATITVNVAHTKAMSKRCRCDLFGDGNKLPRSKGFVFLRKIKAVVALASAN